MKTNKNKIEIFMPMFYAHNLTKKGHLHLFKYWEKSFSNGQTVYWYKCVKRGCKEILAY